MLSLSRGRVVAAGEPGPWQRLEIEVRGERRPAVCDTALMGECVVGDEVVVNTAAVDLGLGSGGSDIVHVNLTRGLGGAGRRGAHVMKLNYTSLQHAVEPVDAVLGRVGPVCVGFLHGQLAPIAFGFDGAGRIGYVQTWGGALPGAMSDTVRELQQRGLLADHLTAGAAYGGRDGDAITLAGALAAGFGDLSWDAAICLPGPGILGSGSPLGHGGMAALDSIHTAAAIGCPVVVAPRRSGADPRERHQGISHHTRTVLDLALVAVDVAEDSDPADYLASGLPATNMGREDPEFFAAAVGAGRALAGMIGAR